MTHKSNVTERCDYVMGENYVLYLFWSISSVLRFWLTNYLRDGESEECWYLIQPCNRLDSRRFTRSDHVGMYYRIWSPFYSLCMLISDFLPILLDIYLIFVSSLFRDVVGGAPKLGLICMRQNVLKLILKSPRFVPFGANQTQFRTYSDIPANISSQLCILILDYVIVNVMRLLCN